jgi:hypothetical protein
MFHYSDSLAIGQVVAVYPEGQSIDVLLSDDGTRLSNVQVMVPTGSSSTGYVDLPDPGLPLDDSRWAFASNPERTIRAIIAFYRQNPVCIGFLLPQVTQVTFKRANFRVDRHASDVYTTIADNGDCEFSHPSGIYLRIAVNPAHEDLTGLDFDKKWAIARNTGGGVHVHLAGLGGMTLDVNPAGQVAIVAPLVTINGVTIDAGGNVHTTATITGDTDVIAGGISGKTHKHGGITRGGALTDPPSP